MILNAKADTAMKAAVVHLMTSILVLSLSAAVIFFIWYPGDFAKLSGITKVFFYLVIVDCFCGPLLTLLIFSPKKKRSVWLKDLAVIIFLQMTAFFYGMFVVFDARPILLVFEGDRFRLVSNLDVDHDALKSSQLVARGFFSKPEVIAARLSHPGDIDYLSSVQLSMQGVYPSFRPDRWIPYNNAIEDVLRSSKPLVLIEKNKILINYLNQANSNAGLYKYLPITIDNLQAENWIAIIDSNNGALIKFLPINGWGD